MRITRKIWLHRVDRKIERYQMESRIASFMVPEGNVCLPVTAEESAELLLYNGTNGEMTIEFKADRAALEVEISNMEKRLGEMRRLLAGQ